jgi:nucleoside-diphosphate-sugar epimerase
LRVFFFGLGYCARRFIALDRTIEASGTARSLQSVAALRAEGVAAHRFDGGLWDDGLAADLERAEAIVVSIPPAPGGDAALIHFGERIRNAPRLRRILYLSTIGVYGDHGGRWVDETSATLAVSGRGLARLEAEAGWLTLGAERGVAVDVLRLAGIYGPGRNMLVKLREGEARRIVKPGHVFNRTHVDDIAQMMRLTLALKDSTEIWNVADEEPAPPQDVVAYAAALLGLQPPPEEAFDAAALSPMAASFYADEKRASIAKAKSKLGFRPIYPTYREGLSALAAAGEGSGGRTR